MNPYRISPRPSPLHSMWFYGDHPFIGASLFFLNSAGNGDGKNGVVNLYNSWRCYMDDGLPEIEIQNRLTLEAHSIFPRKMMETYNRIYPIEDRMLAIMGLTSRCTGVANIPYVRVGTYQGRGELPKNGMTRYTLVHPQKSKLCVS